MVSGAACILNAACVLARLRYPPEAAALEPTAALLVRLGRSEIVLVDPVAPSDGAGD